jgi:hypothetical protein
MPAATYAQALALAASGNDSALLAALLSGYMADGVTPHAMVQRVSAGFMGPGQTAKQYVGKQATSTTVLTTVTLETVTAGKTFYITDILVYTDVAQGATTIDVRLQAAGADIFRSGVHNLAPIDMTGIETQPFATAGQQVTLLLPITAAIQQVWFNIYGFEQ